LNDSTVSGNATAWNGGGILNTGSLTLNRSTVSGNTAGVDGGGGISTYTVDAPATTTLRNATVTNNTPDNCWPLGGVAGCAG